MSSVVNLLVGGPKDLWPASLKSGHISGTWIGVDRGNYWLIKNGVVPQIAIGDFDSMDSQEFKLVQSKVKDLRTYNPIKDYTDTQLAVKLASQMDADIINIYGATGGRLDHFMSNFLLATEPFFKPIAEKIRIIDCQNTIQYFLPGSHTIHKDINKKYLAFIPLNKMELSIDDAKYTLQNEMVPRPIAYSSNEFVGSTVTFHFNSGLICVIQSKDK